MKTYPFDIKPSDGERCYQVLVYNDDDYRHWLERAQKTGHLFALDRFVPQDTIQPNDPPHYIYQIFPPRHAEAFKQSGAVIVP